MKIDSSYIGMESGRTYQSTSTGKLSFRVQMGNTALNTQVGGELQNKENMLTGEQDTEKKGSAESLETKEQADEIAEAMAKLSQASSNRKIAYVNRTDSYQAIKDIRQQCVLYLWTILFGKDRAGSMADKLGIRQNTGLQNNGWSNPTDLLGDKLQTVPLTGIKAFTITAERESLYTESESTSFSTTGIVKTADGRELSFNLDVSMSRSFVQYTKETVQNVGSFIDPLVINLNGNIAEVSDQKFYFDLDADGEKEEISRLSQDSGYLALDLNGDGTINDGSELFGTKSGNGFADLALYDQDGNGWIDENDEIWDKLKIWVQDEEGNSTLYSLKEQGVGAICLQNVSTEFHQKNDSGQVNAAIRNTGIFLYENGSAGTIQHMDLVSNKIARYA